MEQLDMLRKLAVEHDACCEQENRLKAGIQKQWNTGN